MVVLVNLLLFCINIIIVVVFLFTSVSLVLVCVSLFLHLSALQFDVILHNNIFQILYSIIFLK